MRPEKKFLIPMLAEIIQAIAKLNLPFLQGPLKKIGDELDEIKFGLYVLASGTQMDLPEDFLLKAAWRVLQLLNNTSLPIQERDLLKHQLMRVYQLFRKDNMDIGSDIQYAKPYENHLFHLHAPKNQALFFAYQKAGLNEYFANPDLRFLQRATNRLTYYLSNFDFPRAWIEEINQVLLYCDDQISLEPLEEKISGLVNSHSLNLNQDEKVQLLILSGVVFSESLYEKEALKSCYYSRPEVRHLLAAMAAKLPADLLIEKFKRFSQSKSLSQKQRAFCESVLTTPSISKIKPFVQASKENDLQQELSALAKTIKDGSIEVEYKAVAKKIQNCLEGNKIIQALMLAVNFGRQKRIPIKANPMLEPSFTPFIQKYDFFFEVNGECYFRPEGLNSDFSVAPIVLEGDADAFERIKDHFATHLLGFDAIENRLDDHCFGYFRKGKNPVDAFLMISLDPSENKITLELDLHFLSKGQVSNLILRTSKALASQFISTSNNLKTILELHGLIDLASLQTQREEQPAPLQQREEKPAPVQQLESTPAKPKPQAAAVPMTPPPSLVTPPKATPLISSAPSTLTPTSLRPHPNSAFSERIKTPPSPAGEGLSAEEALSEKEGFSK